MNFGIHSIKVKVSVAVCAVFALCAVAALMILNASWNRSMEVLAQQALRSASAGFENLKSNDLRTLRAALDPLMADPRFRAPFQARDLAALERATASTFARLKQEHGVTHWSFIEPDGVCFLRAHDPAKRGDLITRTTFAKARAGQDFGAGLELGKTAFALRMVHPYHDAHGTLLGYMEVGEEIEHFLAMLKKATAADYALVVQKRFLQRADWQSLRKSRGLADNWDQHAQLLVIDSTAPDAAPTSFDGDLLEIPEEGKFLGISEIGNRTLLRGVFPMRDASEQRAGAIFFAADITPAYAGMLSDRRKMQVLFGSSMVGIALLLIWLLHRLVFTRLNYVVYSATRLAAGNYKYRIKMSAPDEIGEMEALLEQLRTIFLRTSRNGEDGRPPTDPGDRDPDDSLF